MESNQDALRDGEHSSRNRKISIDSEITSAVARNYPGLAYLDAYGVTNSLPQSSADGQHWAGRGSLDSERPLQGAADYALYDALFNHWAHQAH